MLTYNINIKDPINDEKIRKNRSGQLLFDYFVNDDLANGFEEYSHSGGHESTCLLHDELKLCLQHVKYDIDVVKILIGCAFLVDSGREKKHIYDSNAIISNWWAPAYSHPLWFYFASYTLSDDHDKFMKERLGNRKVIFHELKDFFILFPEPDYFHIYYIMSWHLLKTLTRLSDDAIRFYTLLTFPPI